MCKKTPKAQALPPPPPPPPPPPTLQSAPAADGTKMDETGSRTSRKQRKGLRISLGGAAGSSGLAIK